MDFLQKLNEAHEHFKFLHGKDLYLARNGGRSDKFTAFMEYLRSYFQVKGTDQEQAYHFFHVDVKRFGYKLVFNLLPKHLVEAAKVEFETMPFLLNDEFTLTHTASNALVRDRFRIEMKQDRGLNIPWQKLGKSAKADILDCYNIYAVAEIKRVGVKRIASNCSKWGGCGDEFPEEYLIEKADYGYKFSDWRLESSVLASKTGAKIDVDFAIKIENHGKPKN